MKYYYTKKNGTTFTNFVLETVIYPSGSVHVVRSKILPPHGIIKQSVCCPQSIEIFEFACDAEDFAREYAELNHTPAPPPPLPPSDSIFWAESATSNNTNKQEII